MAETGIKRIYFENLDATRFVAFILIFMRHGIFTDDATFAESGFFKFWSMVQEPAQLGVPYFFVLSGFLITYLLIQEKNDFGKISIKNFYIRRILRIWPLYYAIVIFGFFVFPYVREIILGTTYEETATLWKYLFFWVNFDQIEHGLPYGAGLGVMWSLSVEEQFYAVWPLLFVFIPSKYYLFLLAGLFVYSSGIQLLYDMPYGHTLVCVQDLSLGGLIAVIVHQRNHWFDGLRAIKKWIIVTIYVLGIASAFIWSLYFEEMRTIVSLFMGFIVFEQCYCEHSFIKWGRYEWLNKLGKMTFGFYLIHTISNFIIYSVINYISSDLNPLCELIIQFFSSFTLTLTLGYFVYHYYEMPFLRLKKRFQTT